MSTLARARSKRGSRDCQSGKAHGYPDFSGRGLMLASAQMDKAQSRELQTLIDLVSHWTRAAGAGGRVQGDRLLLPATLFAFSGTPCKLNREHIKGDGMVAPARKRKEQHPGVTGRRRPHCHLINLGGQQRIFPSFCTHLRFNPRF